MKKICLFLLSVLFIASCNMPKPLYSWYKYDKTSYHYLKKRNENATQALIKNYQAIITKQNGLRSVVPPGIYADYGFILLQAGKIEEGNALLEKEITLYPESKTFIEKIIKMSEK